MTTHVYHHKGRGSAAAAAATFILHDRTAPHQQQFDEQQRGGNRSGWVGLAPVSLACPWDGILLAWSTVFVLCVQQLKASTVVLLVVQFWLCNVCILIFSAQLKLLWCGHA